MNTPLFPVPRHGMQCLSLLLSLGAALCAAPAQPPERTSVTLDSLLMHLEPGENRAVSFTNNRSAYFYTQSHRNDHPEHAWFRGLNIAGRRVFNDWILQVGATRLDPAKARVSVGPDSFTRSHPNGLVETLQLFDDQDVLALRISGTSDEVSLRLSGDQLKEEGSAAGMTWYSSCEGKPDSPTDHVLVMRDEREAIFLIVVGPTREAAETTLAEALHKQRKWQVSRRSRLEGLLNGRHYLWTSDARLTEALRWTTLTTAELLTHQRGAGIYAGLPWFNEYWGRDSFIALSGATLVTGQFETARDILLSFAKFQDLDPKSPFHGRVPNIVKVGSLDYHTTDGTPRFIIALLDYVRYSGDRSILRELYPNIVASIEGAFAHWTDKAGYLVHKDNETWMDARRSTDLASYSPRSNRANDVQVLWHRQLLAGVEAARLLGEEKTAQRWAQAAAKVKENFTHDFLDASKARLADHLRENDSPDYTLRPNLLFALELLGEPETSAPILRRTWETLVFPWGVATLDPADERFHPYHLSEGLYHKDAAYHNGTVWPWLNGIAMQRMIEAGQSALAWELFQNMNRLALTRGVIGGLPETLDAFPHPGEKEPRLTGTFLQAWSNSEQLRIWYQYFLGIRPDLLRNEIVLAPRLPPGLAAAEFSVRVGAGALHAKIEAGADGRHHCYQLEGLAATLNLDLPSYPVRSIETRAGECLEICEGETQARLQVLSPSKKVRLTETLSRDSRRMEQQQRLEDCLGTTRFAAPGEAQPLLKRLTTEQTKTP